jgi:hypothetical protein
MTDRASRLLRVIERLYRMALLAYPRSFRHGYGHAMTQVFRDRCRAAIRQSGAGGLLLMCLVEFCDLAASALRERGNAAGRLVTRTRVSEQPGLLFGVLVGLLYLVQNLISGLAPVNSPLQGIAHTLLDVIILAVMPLMIALAGFWSGRGTRVVQAGTSAGVWAACIASTIMAISLVGTMLLFWPEVEANALHDAGMLQDFHNSQADTFGEFLWEDNLGGAFFLTLFSLLCGGVLGTLGGWLGRSFGNGSGLGEPRR